MTNVDNRVVQMEFDNAEFEKRIKESMETLEKFEKSLELKGAPSGLEEVGKKMNDLAKDVDFLANRFSVAGEIVHDFWYGMANRAIGIFTGAMGKAKNALVEMSDFGQYESGFDKYNKKLTSVRTIMNNTGASIDEVNGYLDELMWYSDETSFNFSDMTSSLATMTSAGGEMQKLVPMIEGIANATAFAGKRSAEFSRVIYNINQSYGAGYLQRQDWKSVELAGVGSRVLKQALIDAGKAMGTLDKNAQTAEGHLVDIGNFGEYLKDKWATTEVMEEAFGRFADFTQVVKIAVDKDINSIIDIYEGIENVPTDLLETLVPTIHDLTEEFGSLEEIPADVLEKFVTEENLDGRVHDIIEMMEDDFDQLSVKAFKAGQECQTFGDVIDAIKDMVSSSWMRSYEQIIGTGQDAIDLWGEVYDVLESIISPISDAREAMVDYWKEAGGRNLMLETFRQAVDNLSSIFGAMKEAWQSIFPPATEDLLMRITFKINQFVRSMKPTQAGLERVYKITQGIATVVKIVWSAIKGVWSVIQPLFTVALNMFDIFLSGFAGIAEAVGFLDPATEALTDFKSAGDAAAKAFSVAATVVGTVINIIKVAILGAITVIGSLIAYIAQLPIVGQLVSGVSVAFQFLQGAVVAVISLIGIAIMKVYELYQAFKNSAFVKALVNIKNYISEAWDALRGQGEAKDNNLYNALSKLTTIVDTFKGVIAQIRTGAANIRDIATGTFGIIVLAISAVYEAMKPIIDKFKPFIQNFKNAAEQMTVSQGIALVFAFSIYEIASSFSVLIKALTGLSNSVKSVVNGVSIFSFFDALKTGIKDFNKSFKTFVFGDLILKVAAAVSLLAISLTFIAGANPGDLIKAGIVLFLVGAALTGLTFVLAKISDIMSDGNMFSGRLDLGILGIAGTIASVALLIDRLAAVWKQGGNNMKAVWEMTGVLAVVLGEFAVFGIIISKWADNFSLWFGISMPIIAVSVLAMCTGMSLMIKAASQLKGNNKLWALVTETAVMGAVILAMIALATTVDPVSVVLLIGFAAAVKLFSSAIDQMLANVNPETMKELSKISGYVIAAIAAMALIAAAIATKNKQFKNVTSSMELVTRSLLEVVGVIALLTWIAQQSKVAAAIGFVGAIALFAGYLMLVNIAQKVVSAGAKGKRVNPFAEMSKGLLILAGAIAVIAWASSLGGDMKIVQDMLSTMAVILVFYGGILAVLSKVDKEKKPTGREFDGIAAIGIGLLAVAAACKVAEKLDVSGFINASIMLMMLASAFAILGVVMNGRTFNADSMLKTAGSVMILALAVDALIPAVAVLSLFPWQAVLAAGTAVALVIGALSLALGKLGDAKVTTGKLLGVMGIIGVIAASFGILAGVFAKTPWETLVLITAGMVFVILALQVLVDSISKIKNSKYAVANLALISMLIISVGGCLGLIGYYVKDNIWTIATAAAGMAGVVFVLGKFVESFAKIKVDKNTAGVMWSLAGIIMAVGLSLAFIGQYDWQKTAAASIGLAGVLTTLILVFNFGIIPLMEVLADMTPERMKTVGSVILKITTALAVASVGMSVLAAQNWIQIGVAAAGLLGVIMFGIVPLVEMLSQLTPQKATTAGTVAIAMGAALFIIALGLTPLAMLNPGSILAAAGAISIVAFVMATLGSLLGNIDASKLWSTSAIMIAMAASVSIIANAIRELAVATQDIDPAQLEAVGMTLGGIILAIGFIAVAMQAVSGALGPWTALAIVLLPAMGWAFQMIANGLAVALPPLETFCYNIIPILGGANLLGIAGGITAIALAMIPMSIAAAVFGVGGSIGAVAIVALGAASKVAAPGIFALSEAVDALAQAMANFKVVMATAGSELASMANSVGSLSLSSMFGGEDNMQEIGGWLGKSLAAGILGSKGEVEDAMITVGADGEVALRDEVQVHSESPKYNEIGGWLPVSFGNGILKKLGVPVDAMETMGGLMEDVGIDIGVDTSGGMVNGLIEKITSNETVNNLANSAATTLQNGLGGLAGMAESLGLSTAAGWAKGLASGVNVARNKLNRDWSTSRLRWENQEYVMTEAQRDAMKAAAAQAKEEESWIDKITKGFDGMGDAAGKGKGGGGAASKVEELVEITDYAKDVIENFKKKLMAADETLSDADAFDQAKANVTELAEYIWKLGATEEQLKLEGNDRLKAIKESFTSFRDTVKDSVGKSINLLNEFSRSYDTAIKDMNKSIKSNYDAVAEYMRYMELGADFMPEDVFQYFVKAGCESVDELRAYMIASGPDKEKFNKGFSGWDEAVKDREMKLLEYTNKNRKANVQLADDTEEAARKEANAVTEATLKIEANAHTQQILFEQIAESAKSAMGSIGDLFGDFNEWEDKTYDNLLDNLKKQSNLFEAFKDTADLSSSELLENMQSQLEGVEEWSNDMDRLGARGLADGLMQKLADMGVDGYEYVKAFSEMTDEELKKANEMFAKAEPGQKEAAKKVSGSFTHQFEQSMEEEMDKVLDKMEGFGDAISEMLADGFNPEYMQKALDSGLLNMTNYEKFQENADMIQEKISHMFELLPEKYELIKSQGGVIGANLVEGIATSTATETGNQIIENATQAANTAMESGKAGVQQLGATYDSQIAKGMIQNEGAVMAGSDQVIADTMNEANTKVTNQETGAYKVGWNISAGMAEGILAGKSMVIEAAIQVALEAIEAAEDELGIESPSKVFAQIGKYCDMGFVNGLDDGAHDVELAAMDMSDSAVTVVKGAMSTLNDILNDTLDLDPTIRPIMDLSDVEAKSESIGAMFSGYGMRLNTTSAMARHATNSMMAKRLAEIQNASPAELAPQYNFTQNNYSPKSLSRVEIYRQTNNQFNHFKNTMAYS